MVAEVWLHIGSAKSGTSSLQKHMMAQAGALSEQGLAVITTGPRRATINALAISVNNGRDDVGAICDRLTEQIETRPERIGFLSSEMLFGFPPARIFELLPCLTQRPLKVLVYLRRQDRYIEALYLQKSKNLRFRGTLQDYIQRFKGSGSDYYQTLSGWFDTQATLVPRVLERGRLVGGSVVPDALAQMGLPHEGIEEAVDTNVSPGIHRVQLLQAAAQAGIADPRQLQRRLAAQFPQDPKMRGAVMSLAERRAFLAQFEESNTAFCQRFFPDQARLFDESDLDGRDPSEGIAPFTPAQMQEIERLLAVVKTMR